MIKTLSPSNKPNCPKLLFILSDLELQVKLPAMYRTLANLNLPRLLIASLAVQVGFICGLYIYSLNRAPIAEPITIAQALDLSDSEISSTDLVDEEPRPLEVLHENLENALAAHLDSGDFRASLDEKALVAAQVQKPEKALVPSSLISYRIEKGDTLTDIFKKHGGTRVQAYAAADALKLAGVSLGSFRAGGTVKLQFDTDGSIKSLETKLTKGRVLKVVVIASAPAKYEVQIESPTILATTRSVSGVITSSLFAAAMAQSVPSEVVDEFADLFGGRVEFRRALSVGDSFSVTYVEERTNTGELVGTGSIQNASILRGTKLYAAIGKTSTNGAVLYFDELGEQLGNYFLRYPVKFTRIASTFSANRLHPILNIRRKHPAVDFAAPQGTAVRSVGAGRVEFAGYRGSAGNMVQIRHDDKYTTVYRHLSRIDPSLRNGSSVSRGQQIGAVGSTGLATGAHLCFSLFKNGQFVDPLGSSLPKLNSSARLDESYLQAQLQDIQEMHRATALAYAESQEQTKIG